MGPCSMTRASLPTACGTFLSLYPRGPRFAIGPRCAGEAGNAGDGRVSGTAALGPGDIRQTQDQQQRQNAAPRGLHHRPVSVTSCRGDKTMEWVTTMETRSMGSIIHSPLHVFTECVLSTRADPALGAGVTQIRLLLSWGWRS